MTELANSLSSWIAIAFCVFVMLLSVGANLAPSWAKSRSFLLIAGALIIAGSGAMA